MYFFPVPSYVAHLIFFTFFFLATFIPCSKYVSLHVNFYTFILKTTVNCKFLIEWFIIIIIITNSNFWEL